MHTSSLILLICICIYSPLSIATKYPQEEKQILSTKAVAIYYAPLKGLVRQKENPLLTHLPQELITYIIGFLPVGIELYTCAQHTSIDDNTANRIAKKFITHASRVYESNLPAFGMSLIKESQCKIFNALLPMFDPGTSLKIGYKKNAEKEYPLSSYLDELKKTQNLEMLQSLILIQRKATKNSQNNTYAILAKDIPNTVRDRLPYGLKSKIKFIHIEDAAYSFVNKTSRTISLGTACLCLSPILCTYGFCEMMLSAYSEPIYRQNHEYTYLGN